MTIEMFLVILGIAAVATPTGIEVIKKVLDKFRANYNVTVLSVIVAFTVGATEVIIFTSLSTPITLSTLGIAMLMGITNAIGATTSYDLVKKFVLELFGKQAK